MSGNLRPDATSGSRPERDHELYRESLFPAERLAWPDATPTERDGADPAVWLDAKSPLHDADSNGVTGMRARAEAARWRGHAEEAARWEERAQHLEAQFAIPDKSLLARLAGLAG